MNTSTNLVRHGVGVVRPYIYWPVELPEFVRETFDAVALERHEFGPTDLHVELQICGTASGSDRVCLFAAASPLTTGSLPLAVLQIT